MVNVCRVDSLVVIDCWLVDRRVKTGNKVPCCCDHGLDAYAYPISVSMNMSCGKQDMAEAKLAKIY
jgi:hypothetical protein